MDGWMSVSVVSRVAQDVGLGENIFKGFNDVTKIKNKQKNPHRFVMSQDLWWRYGKPGTGRQQTHSCCWPFYFNEMTMWFTGK